MQRKFWFGSLGLIVFLSVVLIISWQFGRRAAGPDNNLSNNQPIVSQSEPDLPTATSVSPLFAQVQPTVKLPQDSEFMVSGGSATATIRFIEGSIKPLDVHVGDTQNFRIVVTSPNGIKKVIAEIETDQGIHEVELGREGVVSIMNTYPNPYTVNPEDNTLKILDQDQLVQARLSEHQRELAQKKTNQANAASGQREVWTGSWVVKDTHDKIYHTNFVAHDSGGNKGEMTMSWSDLCAIPFGGNWVSSSTSPGGCLVPSGSVDGVDNGDAFLVAGYNLNLSLGNIVFSWNNGHKVDFIRGGQLILAANKASRLKQGYLYVPDADGDRYMPFGALTRQTTTAAVGYHRRSIMINTSTVDCLDTDNSVFPGYDIYSNVPISGQTGASAWDYDCSGSINMATTASISSSTIKDFTYFCNAASAPMANGCNEPYFGCAADARHFLYYVSAACDSEQEDPNLPQLSKTIIPRTFSKPFFTWRESPLIKAAKAQTQARLSCCPCVSADGCYVYGCNDINANLDQISRRVSYQQCGQSLFPATIKDNYFYGAGGSTCNGSFKSFNSDLNQHFFATIGTTTKTFYCK